MSRLAAGLSRTKTSGLTMSIMSHLLFVSEPTTKSVLIFSICRPRSNRPYRCE